MLNPIEHVWAWLKGKLKDGISTNEKLPHIADVTFDLFEKYTAEMAQKYVAHCDKEEEVVKKYLLVNVSFAGIISQGGPPSRRRSTGTIVGTSAV
jgi:hypothetical protein